MPRRTRAGMWNRVMAGVFLGSALAATGRCATSGLRGIAYDQAGDSHGVGAARVPLLRGKGVAAVCYRESQPADDVIAAAEARGYTVLEHLPAHRVLVLRGEEKQDPAVVARSLPGIVYADRVYAPAAGGAPILITPRVIARMPPGTDRAHANTYARSRGLRVVRPARGLQDVYLLEAVDPPPGQSVLDFVRTRSADPEIVWMEPDFIGGRQRDFVPDDPYYPQQWHLRQSIHVDGDTNAHIHAEQAWDLTRGTSTVVIAIIDEGIDWSHPDLAANIFVNPGEYGAGKQTNDVDDDGNGFVDDWHGWDFGADDNDPGPSRADEGHGTAVAGLAAAMGNNGLGVSGVAPDCRILPVRIDFDVSSASQFAEAIAYAPIFADVLNCSWGGFYSQAEVDAINHALENGRGGKGCPIFCSSGNGDTAVGHPASVPGTIAVGGSGHTDQRVEYSNYGPELDFVAPTGGGYAGIWTTDQGGTNAGYNTVNGWQTFTYPLAAGYHNIQWAYAKDGHDDEGWDSAWLDDVSLPGRATETFETGGWSSPGWGTGGHAGWHADQLKPFAGSYSLRSGDVGNYGSSTLYMSDTFPAGDMSFQYYISSSLDHDRLYVVVDGLQVGSFSGLNGDANGDYLDGFSGTSASSPIAAGIGALLLSAHPELTADDVRRRMQWSADKVGGVEYPGGRNDEYGYGRINAYRALVGPMITSAAEGRGHVGVPYAYDENNAAEAIGQGPLTWSLVNGPPSFTIHPDTGAIEWTPTYGGAIVVTIRVTSPVGSQDQSWTVRVPGAYYVNDDATTHDAWCTTPGNDANDGLTVATPKRTVQALLAAIDFEPGDTMRIDTGDYVLNSTISMSSYDGGSDEESVTIEGSPYGVVIDRALPNPGFITFDLTAPYVEITTAESTRHPGVGQRWMKLTGAHTGLRLYYAEHCTAARLEVSGNAGDGIYLFGGHHAALRNLVVHDNGAHGVNLYYSTDSILENSTIANNAADQVHVDNAAARFSLRNNVLLADGPGRRAAYLYAVGYLVSSDFNLFHILNGAAAGFAGAECPTLADWRTATGKDSLSLELDPLLADTAGGDFHLKSAAGRYLDDTWTIDATNSPAIDTADPSAGYSREPAWNGVCRNAGAYGNTPQASKSTDADNDGLSDNLETLRFETRPDLPDTDFDGMWDGAEFLAGTDPTNDASLLRVTPGADGTASAMVIQWPSASNRTYIVERSPDPAASAFLPLASGIPAHPPVNAYTDTVDTLDTAAYRIQVQTH